MLNTASVSLCFFSSTPKKTAALVRQQRATRGQESPHTHTHRTPYRSLWVSQYYLMLDIHSDSNCERLPYHNIGFLLFKWPDYLFIPAEAQTCRNSRLAAGAYHPRRCSRSGGLSPQTLIRMLVVITSQSPSRSPERTGMVVLTVTKKKIALH